MAPIHHRLEQAGSKSVLGLMPVPLALLHTEKQVPWQNSHQRSQQQLQGCQPRRKHQQPRLSQLKEVLLVTAFLQLRGPLLHLLQAGMGAVACAVLLKVPSTGAARRSPPTL